MSNRYPFLRLHNSFPPQFIHPPPPQKLCQPQNFVPITHAAPAHPDPKVWRFCASVPNNAVPLVGTSVIVNTVQLSPLSNTQVPTALSSSFHVQASAGSQNYVTPDFMQANPFSSSAGAPPPLSLRSLRQRMGQTFRTCCVVVTDRIPHFRPLLWTPRI